MNKGITLIALGLTCLASTSAFASTDVCNVTIEANSLMQFNTDNISVPSTCESATLTLKNAKTDNGQGMSHNWVLSEPKDMQSLVSEGLTAGPEHLYLPPNDKRVLAYTDWVKPGQSQTINIPVSQLQKGHEYNFFCSFPGHWTIMKGRFTVQ